LEVAEFFKKVTSLKKKSTYPILFPKTPMTDELSWTNLLVTESEVIETLKLSIMKGPSAPGEGKMTFRD
jgi:hypothetical protein